MFPKFHMTNVHFVYINFSPILNLFSSFMRISFRSKALKHMECHKDVRKTK